VQGTSGEPYDPRQVYDAVVVELNKLLVNPDPEQLELTVSRDCDCFRGWYDFFEGLRRSGERYSEQGVPEVTYFRVVQQEPGQFRIYLADRTDAGPIVDSSGRPLRDPPLSAVEAKELTLAVQDGSWKISQLRYLVDEHGDNLGDRVELIAP